MPVHKIPVNKFSSEALHGVIAEFISTLRTGDKECLGVALAHRLMERLGGNFPPGMPKGKYARCVTTIPVDDRRAPCVPISFIYKKRWAD